MSSASAFLRAPLAVWSSLAPAEQDVLRSLAARPSVSLALVRDRAALSSLEDAGLAGAAWAGVTGGSYGASAWATPAGVSVVAAYLASLSPAEQRVLSLVALSGGAVELGVLASVGLGAAASSLLDAGVVVCGRDGFVRVLA